MTIHSWEVEAEVLRIKIEEAYRLYDAYSEKENVNQELLNELRYGNLLNRSNLTRDNLYVCSGSYYLSLKPLELERFVMINNQEILQLKRDLKAEIKDLRGKLKSYLADS